MGYGRMKIVTIGVYGYTADEFFSDLQNAGVDLFFDIRWRRGVRGPDYIFANHKRLQARLESLGIGYIHRKDLAPTPEIRKKQQNVDKSERVTKRKRDELSEEFKNAYQQEILAHFDPYDFIRSLGDNINVVAFCCVERVPEACHRSLVASAIQDKVGVDVEHLVPG